jgi:hypothetical protein
MSMNAIECTLLLSNLSRTREWLLPGESMPFHQYWQYCLGSFVDEASVILRASQLIIWVDGQPVLDPASPVPVTCGSQFALSLGHRWLTEILPHGAWWN